MNIFWHPSNSYVCFTDIVILSGIQLLGSLAKKNFFKGSAYTDLLVIRLLLVECMSRKFSGIFPP